MVEFLSFHRGQFLFGLLSIAYISKITNCGILTKRKHNMLHFSNPDTGEKHNPWATEKKMRCKVWKTTLFLGKNGYKNTYRRRYDCINLR